MSACSGTQGNQKAEGLASRYVPLSVGNEWVYDFGLEGNKQVQTIRVTGTQEFNGKTWYIIRTLFDGKEQPDTLHWRTQGSKLLFYHTRMGTVMTLIDFARTNADSNDLSVAYVSQKDQTTTIREKTWANCVVTSSGYVDAEVATYAPNVGLVQSFWFRGRRELIRATINGKTVQ